MTAFINHFSFEFNAGIRDKQLLLVNYLLPLGFYFMMAFIMPGINPPFLETLIPAMVTFAILSATLLGIPDPLVKAREDGIYRSYKINGVPSSSIVTIPAITTILHLVIVTVIITVTAPLLFNAPVPVNWLNYLITFVVMAFASAGLSVLIGVLSSSTRMTVMWSQLIYLPSMLLGGLMLPSGLLPPVVMKISQLLPATQSMNAFNALAMGKVADFNPWGSVAVLFISGILSFGLAIYMFSWDSRNEGRRGHPLMALLVLLPFVVGILFF
ncbi:MAG: ABC transporter permease [Anaerolineales bacterium]